MTKKSKMKKNAHKLIASRDDITPKKGAAGVGCIAGTRWSTSVEKEAVVSGSLLVHLEVYAVAAIVKITIVRAAGPRHEG